ncbi:DUF1302 family protein, partial [Massilia orientalis]
MKNNLQLRTAVLVAMCFAVGSASAVDFTLLDNQLKATWTTDMTLGGGIRLKNPSCSLTGDPTSFGCGSGANV